MHLSRTLGMATLLMLVFTSGCAVNKATGGLTAGVELDMTDSYYVVKLEEDERGIEKIIATQLAERGFQVSSGSSTDMPEGTDVIVAYIDRWMWDMTMYMIELTITLSDATSEFTLANGNSYHTSLTRKSPEKMVAEVLSNILDGGAE